jgi:hypothetical protein
MSLIGLALANNKFTFAIFLPTLSSFLLNPVFESHFFDTAEIVELHVVWILICLVSYWCQ